MPEQLYRVKGIKDLKAWKQADPFCRIKTVKHKYDHKRIKTTFIGLDIIFWCSDPNLNKVYRHAKTACYKMQAYTSDKHWRVPLICTDWIIDLHSMLDVLVGLKYQGVPNQDVSVLGHYVQRLNELVHYANSEPKGRLSFLGIYSSAWKKTTSQVMDVTKNAEDFLERHVLPGIKEESHEDK